MKTLIIFIGLTTASAFCAAGQAIIYQCTDTVIVYPAETFAPPAEPFRVMVYPNPTSGIFELKLPDLQKNQKASLEIYTLAFGRLSGHPHHRMYGRTRRKNSSRHIFFHHPERYGSTLPDWRRGTAGTNRTICL